MDMLVNVMKEAGEFGEGLPIPAISRPRERCQPPLDCSWSHSQRTSLDGASRGRSQFGFCTVDPGVRPPFMPEFRFPLYLPCNGGRNLPPPRFHQAARHPHLADTRQLSQGHTSGTYADVT